MSSLFTFWAQVLDLQMPIRYFYFAQILAHFAMYIHILSLQHLYLTFFFPLLFFFPSSIFIVWKLGINILSLLFLPCHFFFLLKWLCLKKKISSLKMILTFFPSQPEGKAGFPDSSVGKDSTCNAGDPGLGRSPGAGKVYPLQYSGLENSRTGLYSPWGHKESDTTGRLSFEG